MSDSATATNSLSSGGEYPMTRSSADKPGTPGWLDHPDSNLMPAYGLLDNIRSVGNVGSMFRTADAVALGGLFLCGMTATPPRLDMEKTALGATRSVPWDYWADSLDAAKSLKAQGLPLVVLENAPGAIAWDKLEYPFPHCFVVGHEVKGVRPEILELADHVVEIPMAGTKNSLNVAVSFGIMVFELRRRWQVSNA